MADNKRELSVRLSAEGGAQLTDTFRQIGTAGEQAFQQIDKSAGATSGNLDQLDRKLATVTTTTRQSQTALQQQINAAVGIDGSGSGSAAASAATFQYGKAAQLAQVQAQLQAAQQASAALIASKLGQQNGIEALGAGGVAGSAAASASVFAEAEKEMAALEQQAQLLIARYDPLTAAQTKYTQGVDTANKLLDAGKITTQQHAAALAGEKTALDAVTQQFDPLNSKLKLSYTDMEILRSGAVNVVQSLAAGMDPLQVFTTQLAQTAPALGSVATNAGLSTAALVALGIPIATIAAGAIALGIALEKGGGQSRDFARAQQVTANAADLTAQGLNDIVDSATELSTIGPQAARAIATEMEGSGKIAGDVIAKLTALTADYAAGTKQSVEDAGKDLTTLFSDPQRALQQLDSAYNLLSASERRHIQDLIEQGDKTQAQIDLADKLNDRFKHLSTDGMGVLGKSWAGVSAAASDAWDAMLGLGRGTTLEQRLAEAQQALANLQQKAQDEGNPGYLQPGIRQAQSVVTDLQHQVDFNQFNSQSEAAAAHLQDLGKQADDAATKYGGFAQKQHDLTNEIAKWQAAEKELRQASLGADSVKQAQDYAKAADNAHASLVGAQTALAALQTPLDQAQKQLENARQVANLPAYLRGPQQAYLTTLQQDQNSTDPTVRAQAEAHAESVKTQAILQQNTAIADQNQVAQVNHELALSVADAWSKSQADGTAADAARQAALDNLNSGIDVTTRKLQILRASSDDALVDATKQAAQLRQQNLNDDLILNAAQDGPAAEQAAKLSQQITARIEPLRTALANAINNGQVDTAKALATQIQNIDEGMRHAADDAQQLDLTHSILGQRDQIELLQRQLDLVGQNNAAQAVGLAQTQAEIELRREGKSTLDAEGQAYVANAERIAQLNTELQRQRDVANELPQAFDQAFDRIGSALTDAEVQTGNWEESFKNLGNVGLGILSELEQELVKLSFINPLKNALNGDSALPDLGSVFGRLFNTTDYQISNMIASNPGIFADGGVMTSKGKAELPMYRYAEGGVAYRPQLALFGEGDDPEAYVPLKGGAIPVRLSMPERIRAATAPTMAVQAAGVEVNVYNYGNDQVKTQTQQQPNGKQLISLIIGEVAKDVASNGVVGQQIRKSYGLTQQAAVRR